MRYAPVCEKNRRLLTKCSTIFDTSSIPQGVDLTKIYHKAQSTCEVSIPFHCSLQLILPFLLTCKSPVKILQKDSNYLSTTTLLFGFLWQNPPPPLPGSIQMKFCTACLVVWKSNHMISWYRCGMFTTSKLESSWGLARHLWLIII